LARIGRSPIGGADLRVNLVAVDRQRRRRNHIDADAVTTDAQHADLDAVADDDGFAASTREDEHG
jgi:hypothetical protein